MGRAHALACRAAVEAGSLLVTLRDGPPDARLKDGHELVTRADLESDRLVRQLFGSHLRRHRVVSEDHGTGGVRNCSTGRRGSSIRSTVL